MPSTPRMQSIERKASQVGDPLTHEEVSEWHLEHVESSTRLIDWLAQRNADLIAGWNAEFEKYRQLSRPLADDAPKAIRYLDSTQYRPAMKERNHG